MVSTLLLSAMPDRSANPAQVPTGEIERPFIASPLLRGQPSEGKIDAILREPREEEDAPARLAITPLAATPTDDVMPVALDWLEFADESELLPLTPMSDLPGGAAGYVPGGPAETVAVGGLDAPAPGDAAFGTIEPLRAPTPVELGTWATASASFLSGLDEDPEIVPLSGGGTPTVWADQSVDGAAAETLPGENEDWAYVLINRFSSPSSGGTQYPALSVRVLIGGTATIGVDYTTVPALSADASGYANLTIPAGVTSYGVEIHPIDDTLWEGSETVTVSVASGTGYNASGGTIVAGIADNERLDLDIDDKNETEEDTIGGLVVKNSLGTPPPRKKIIIRALDGLTEDVTLSRNNSKVKVFPVASGGNEIPFNGTNNKFPANSLPKTLYVEPVDASGSMRDVTLSVSAPTVPGDSVKFTVLYVDPITLRKTTGDELSPGNDKRDLYKTVNADNDYEIGFPKILKYSLNPGETKWRTGYAYELVGTVHPSNFSHPDVSGIKIRKQVNRKTFNFDVLDQNTGGFVEDNSPAAYLDTNPSPDDRVYDIDTPAKVWDTTVPGALGEIYRYRANFQVWAVAVVNGQEVDASGLSQYFVRFSLENMVNNGNDWQPVNDVAGDNTAAGGTTPLTWDLQ